jgi:hypothetical protein
MHRSSRPARRSVSTIGAVAAALCLVVGVPAFATAAGPDYRADITPGTVPAGRDQDPTLILTLTHLATTSREIGSVRIRPPGGITLTGATAKRGSNLLDVAVTATSVTVSNLRLNDDHATATVTIKVDIPCGDAYDDRIWRVDAVKNQTFDDNATLLVQDEDSHLRTQVDRCSLRFLTQPASAAVGKTITSVAADPNGEPPVRVELLDGNGNRAHQADVDVDLVIVGGGDLGGGFTGSTNSDGVAEFGPTITQPGLAYQLRATYSSSSIADSSPSAEFDITDAAVDCPNTGTCKGPAIVDGDTTASVTATSTGVLSYTLGLNGDDIDCEDAANHYYRSDSEVLTFNVTSATGRTTVTITLKASSVDRAARKYEVCFSSVKRFTNLYGVVIEPGIAGLLAACPKKVALNADPCVKSKARANNGDVVVIFDVPGGDPRGRI